MKKLNLQFILSMMALLLGLGLSNQAQASPGTPYGSERWHQAKVTYVIQTKSPYYRTVYKKAIKAWNATGKFKFVAGSAKNHQVVLTTSASTSQRGGEVAGNTTSYSNRAGYYTSAKVKLLTKNLQNNHYTETQRSKVAEHELGHVIGLNHSTNNHSVMLSTNRYNGITTADKNAVHKRYTTKVGKGTLN